eukprot:765295-Hanusia_phi.AAC.4
MPGQHARPPLTRVAELTEETPCVPPWQTREARSFRLDMVGGGRDDEDEEVDEEEPQRRLAPMVHPHLERREEDRGERTG